MDGPQRIVSLGGDLTEIVVALGAEDRIVARDSTSSYPASVQALLDVGYVRALNAEGILALSPTLVIASAEAGPPEALDQLRAAGVDIVVPPSGYTQKALLARIDMIGDALGAESEADALEADLTRKMEAATRPTTGSDKPKVLFLLSGRDGSPMAAGTETAAHAMIQLAGGRNVFDTHSGYKAYSFEAMAAAAPDVIMMMDHSLTQLGGLKGLSEHPAIGLTPAARNGRIVASDGTFLLGFGPRLPEAISFVAEGFHSAAEPSGPVAP
ncbi:helical backbone metal receptor [uncultured Algimonas sp.]|uniref:heme/hemin ABC transporter substrate-binding protein n=1 Tax=uncultured Algimonas sp. TaxID=1547920 RepID=UPI00262D7EFF|nr:helical backbone metal receptor [uncultured Algimonas sp.]